MRASRQERELEKLAAAFERAQNELTRREKELEAAQAEREEAHERAAADAFLDDNPESARTNGKDRRLDRGNRWGPLRRLMFRRYL